MFISYSIEEAREHGYKPPLSGTWRRVLNIVMVLSNCRQLDLATFCGFAQSSLSLWVNGKYTGDTKAILGKFRKWLDATYPELGQLAKKYANATGTTFQTACYPWLSSYVNSHPELGLNEADVCFLLSFDENGKPNDLSKPKMGIDGTEDIKEKKRLSVKCFNDAVIPSLKVYETDFDFEGSLEHIRNYGPIGTCCLLSEEYGQTENQDRTVVFNNYKETSVGIPPIEPEYAEQSKKVAGLPPAIAAPLPDYIQTVYIQPVEMKELEEACEKGLDISYCMNDVTKTLVYEDRSLDPQGYNVKNSIVGVIDNTLANYNSLRINSTALRCNNRHEIESANILSQDALVVLPVLNSRHMYSFNPGTIRKEKKEEEEEEKKEDEMMVEEKEEEKDEMKVEKEERRRKEG